MKFSINLFLYLVSVTIVTGIGEYPCEPPAYSFCNRSLSIRERAKLLVSSLTLEDKIHQLTNNASSIPHLGIPSYQYWSESQHGIASNGPGVIFLPPTPSATSYPQVILLSSSFNTTLWDSVASHVSIEGRSMHNVGRAGLTFWAPTLNLLTDPRWGRAQETPGEDPLLASSYASHFVSSFQSPASFSHLQHITPTNSNNRALLAVEEDRDFGLMTSACCKHFIGYALEKWAQFTRYTVDSLISEQDLEDTYKPPFRSCIQKGQASCLMCSYNRVNGIPMCARQDMFEEARTEWGFNGYVTSDCDAVATVYEYQKYVKSPEDAVSVVLKAGMDLNCGTFLLRHTLSAIEKGKVVEEDIDKALMNLFSVQLRLGIFDGNPRKGKYGKLGAKDVCTLEHKKLALEAAKQGIVLLKNDIKFLPLKRNAVSSLSVIGPLAIDPIRLLGGYSGVPCRPISIYEGLQDYVKKTYHTTGCFNVSCESDHGFDDAILIAKKVDINIVVVGLDLSQETEDLDRVSLILPGKQMSLVLAIASISKKPIILVLTGGGPLDVSFVKNHQQVASILWIGYPGESGGKALAEIIFGDFNPGGRLPVTWYLESFTNIPMNDMRMRPDSSRGYPGRTYRFYTGPKVYDFGHGLSYTHFTHNFISAPNKIRLSRFIKAGSRTETLRRSVDRPLDYIYVDDLESCDSLNFAIRIRVANVGDMDGSHVVMLFFRVLKILHGAPEKQLVGFSRVHTRAYKATEVTISVDPCEHLTFADEHGKRILPLGGHLLMSEETQHYVSFEI